MIPKLAEVEMCLNRDLVDPNFNSYKLNLDTLPVRHTDMVLDPRTVIASNFYCISEELVLVTQIVISVGTFAF